MAACKNMASRRQSKLLQIKFIAMVDYASLSEQCQAKYRNALYLLNCRLISCVKTLERFGSACNCRPGFYLVLIFSAAPRTKLRPACMQINVVLVRRSMIWYWLMYITNPCQMDQWDKSAWIREGVFSGIFSKFSASPLSNNWSSTLRSRWPLRILLSYRIIEAPIKQR